MRLKLEIDTGSGNRALVADLGAARSAYREIWIKAGMPTLAELHGRSADDVVRTFDEVIDRMRDNPAQFNDLPEATTRDYPQALDYLLAMRNHCRLHPSSRFTTPPA
jgi:hypothetical protein